MKKIYVGTLAADTSNSTFNVTRNHMLAVPSGQTLLLCCTQSTEAISVPLKSKKACSRLFAQCCPCFLVLHGSSAAEQVEEALGSFSSYLEHIGAGLMMQKTYILPGRL